MAQLIVEAAQAAREEAARVRVASHELRIAVRTNSRIAQVRTEQAALAAATANRNLKRAMICPSPWSGLEWSREDEQLSSVLVPVD